MKSFFVLIVLVTVCSAIRNRRPGVGLKHHIPITMAKPGFQSELPSVYGLRSCGGVGKLVDARIQGCAKDSICRLPGNNSPIPSELEFIPSQDINGLSIQLNQVIDGERKTFYEHGLDRVNIQGGERYIVWYNDTIPEEQRGQTVTLQYALLREADRVYEVCTEGDFEIY